MANLTLRSKEDVRLAIRRRGAQIAAEMTDREIYESPEFSDYATNLADFILRNHKLYHLRILFDPDPDAPIAFTDGKNITWNTGNPIAKAPKLLERRFKVNIGILFHEVAHKLFLDFKTASTALNKIENGALYGKFQIGKDPVLKQAHDELEEVTSSGYGGAIAEVYGHIANILADGHDEAAMKSCFPGFIAECIETAGEVQMETSPSIAEKVKNRERPYSILSMMILTYAKFGTYKAGDDTQEVTDYLNKMIVLEPLIDDALACDRVKDRWNHINMIMLHIWPDIRDMFPKNPQGAPSAGQSGQTMKGTGSNPSGQSAQGNQQASSKGQPGNNRQQNQNNTPGNNPSAPPSPEAVKQILAQIAKDVEKQLGANPAPVNVKENGIAPNQVSSGGIDPGSASEVQQIAQKVGEKNAAAQIQSELDKAQMDAIRGANLPMVHQQVPLEVRRHFTPNKSRYQYIHSKVETVVRNLVRAMRTLLRELNDEDIHRHRHYGPIIEATEAYRPDNAYFAKKKLPDDLPNMALCVLLDQSGSMYGTKTEAARETVIMLERFAAGLDIPVMIAGHDTTGADCNLYIYTDFISTISDEDRYALANISAGGCNRDGLALRVCCEMLAKRPEDIRMLIVISDGAPNHHNYSGVEAMEDISKTVTEFRRKGLQIYGAAIDEDREVIEKIYGKNFLSIEDLTSMPRTMVRLVRQNIA